MILARPIRRTSYLFGRYLGILRPTRIFLAGRPGLAVLFAVGAAARWSTHGRRPPSRSTPLGRGDGGGAFLNALLFAAILLFFSTFLRGYADVLAYLVLSIALSRCCRASARRSHKPWLQRRPARAAARTSCRKWTGARSCAARHILGEPTGQWVLAVVAYF